MLNSDGTTEFPKPVTPVYPCWFKYPLESEAAFDESVVKLNDWYEKMAAKILSQRNENTDKRIKTSGRKYIIYKPL